MADETKSFIELLLQDEEDIELIKLLKKDFDPQTVLKNIILGD